MFFIYSHVLSFTTALAITNNNAMIVPIGPSKNVHRKCVFVTFAITPLTQAQTTITRI